MNKNSTKSTKKHARSQNKFAKWLAFVVVVLMAIGLLSVYQSIYAPSSRPVEQLHVQKGDTYHKLLIQKKWFGAPLAHPFVGRVYLALISPKSLQAGEYQIPQGASFAQLVDVLQQGAKSEQVSIRIIEGKTVKDLYHAIKNTEGVTLEILTPAADGYAWVDVARDNQAVAEALGIQAPNAHLEGWFAPNTYHFNKGVSDRVILQRLYDTQKQLLEQAWQNRAADLPYKNAYEALIMASIIEKETGIADERGLVASVFINRLRKKMRLQTDPTIIYGLFDRYDGKIYRSNINERTDYNTYQIDGLPPTPIALPSKQAIIAALNPEASDVYYFVATGKGGHKFSRTLDEHNQAVAEYRAVMKAKEAQAQTQKEKPE